MHGPVHTRPAAAGLMLLGKTIPDLLYEADENPVAFNQPDGSGWSSISTTLFRERAEEIALGLVALGLGRGDRVALLMESDLHFCLADMGCLIAGMVDVPIYVTHASHAVQFVARHSGSRVLFISKGSDAGRLQDLLPGLPELRFIVMVENDLGGDLPELPEGVQCLTLDELRAKGRFARTRGEDASRMRSMNRASDLATIIYTSGTTGEPKGVMLSHENISSNALAAFSELTGFRRGPGGEVTISFLPLTHVFARTLYYGFMAYGSTIYFSTPEALSADLQRVRPTTFATVPRLLEKVYSRIRQRAATLTGVKKALLQESLAFAGAYRLGAKQSLLQRAKHALLDRLVFAKWREALGGRVRFIISGGAALAADLTNIFAAARVPVLQGYGLTESSPVISYNRPDANRAGTVGPPLPLVEVTIAEDGEILTRGPHVMMGYYLDPARTGEAIDRDGWLHTGDIGTLSDDGYVTITDRKKDLFKLSTGKFVTPQPLESRLGAEPLVAQAVVIGTGHKYCAALLFPDEDVLRVFVRSRGMSENQPFERLVKEPVVIARFQEIVDKANEGMDPWSTVKRFHLVPQSLSTENGLLTPTMKLKRSRVREVYADEISRLYEGIEAGETRGEGVEA